jgi:hypothetical protein
MTANKARQKLKKDFPTETVEDYDNCVVIVSRVFDSQTNEERKLFIRGKVPEYKGGLILRTPLEVKEQWLHPAGSSPE